MLSYVAASSHERVAILLAEWNDAEADSKDTVLVCEVAEVDEAVLRLLIEHDDVEADSKDNDG
jgi:hypothetical protein